MSTFLVIETKILRKYTVLPSKIFQINIGDGCIQFNVIKIHFLFSSDTSNT